ncbi:Gti1/Pac2 family-domain-containing protein [Xylariales sp. PMI_506]|nr:Gti1/Pac2 family-domain-containing protein [Xylariales sp. PMI_506]
MGISEALTTYIGYINSTEDAYFLLDACLQGLLPQVSRRLGVKEREKLIKSGNIFIYDENLSNMRRWTDGRAWSRRRKAGGFYIYHELQNRKGSVPKTAGLVRKMANLIRNGVSYRLVSYFYDHDVQSGFLTTPTSYFGSIDAADDFWSAFATDRTMDLTTAEWGIVQPWIGQGLGHGFSSEIGLDKGVGDSELSETFDAN